MIADKIEELRKNGMDGKGDQMELMAWGFEEEVGGCPFLSTEIDVTKLRK